MKTAIPSLLTALVCLGCSHSMTAEEHRDQAYKEQTAAITEEKQFDPQARAQAVQGGPAMVGKGPFDIQPDMPRLATYNPTERHLAEAEAHRHAADSHLKAAQELEHFEDAACVGVSKEARAGCPLLSPKISEVEEIAAGVRLHVKSGVDADELAKTMSCHLAFARAHGYDAPSCPLYRAGVSLRTEAGVIELRTGSAQTAANLRHDARVLFAPATTTALRQDER